MANFVDPERSFLLEKSLLKDLIDTDPLIHKAYAGDMSGRQLILAMGERHKELIKELIDHKTKCTCQIKPIFINIKK